MKNFIFSFIFVAVTVPAFADTLHRYKDVRSPSKVYQDSMQLLTEAKNHGSPDLVLEVAQASARDLGKFMTMAYQSLLSGDVQDTDAVRAALIQYAARAAELPEDIQNEQLKILNEKLSAIKLPKTERDLRAEMTKASSIYKDSLGHNLRFKGLLMGTLSVVFATGGLPAFEHVMSNVEAYALLFLAPEAATGAYAAFRYGMRPTGKGLTPEERQRLRKVESDLNRLSITRDWKSCQLLLGHNSEGASGGGLKIHF